MTTHNFDKSNFIKSCSHDKDKNVLTVTFQNGKTYHYGDCGHDDFEAFKNSKSAGSHFSQHIKGKKGLYQP